MMSTGPEFRNDIKVDFLFIATDDLAFSWLPSQPPIAVAVSLEFVDGIDGRTFRIITIVQDDTYG